MSPDIAECLPGGRDCPRLRTTLNYSNNYYFWAPIGALCWGFIHIITFSLDTSLSKQAISFPFYTRWNWGPEMLRKPPNTTQLVSAGGDLNPGLFAFKAHVYYFLFFLSYWYILTHQKSTQNNLINTYVLCTPILQFLIFFHLCFIFIFWQ